MKQFDKVPIKVPAKNVFNLSHDVKASYNFDKLYPFLCQPVYPGDTFNCRAEVFLRTMPLLSPLMHNVDMRLYFFFVPNRIIWNENKKKDWKVFITGGEDGLQSPELPYFTYGDLASVNKSLLDHGSLLDHMGFPTATLGDHAIADNIKDERICSLPFRAYQCVYNEYFRNQNVQNEVEFNYDEGAEKFAGFDGTANVIKLFTMRKKCWEKDYFTSCLPWAQRGEAVRLPIDFSNVENEAATIYSSGTVLAVDRARNFDDSNIINELVAHTSGGSKFFPELGDGDASGFVNDKRVKLIGAITENIAVEQGDITFTGFAIGTINDFRYCLRLQQWLENNARCGSRYIEQLLAHFGVVSSDARLQRPELLGGAKIPLLFTDIPQQSYGDGSDDQTDNVTGNLVGKGTLYGKSDGFKKYFEEHGILLGILTILPRTSYSQGIPRVWSAFDKTDWYFPEFANLGEQAVLNKELYVQLDKALESTETPNGVFGYQGRFTELRYIPSSVHGEMRSDLQFWHLGRLFSAEPDLNANFVECNSRVNVFAMEDIVNSGYDPFVCQIHLDIKAVRPLPKYAVPTL